MTMRVSAIFLCVAMAAAAEVDNNPLGTVLSLLSGLEAKITKEGEAEEKAFKEYVAWCDDSSANLGFEIKTATSKQEELEATISKETSDAATADSRIGDLASEIASDDKELADATTIRNKEAKDFAAAQTELVDVIDTLARAVNTLQREMQKNPAAFAQISSPANGNLIHSLEAVVDAAAFSSADKDRLVAMVQSQQSDQDDDAGAPDAAVYKTHSTNIVDVLEDLKEKAEDELSSLRKAESNSNHNFEMLRQSLNDETAANNKDMGEQKAAKAAAAGAKATAEGDLAATVKDLANAKKALATANSNCMTVAADHDASTKARAEELKVIAEAKKILADTTSEAVSQTYSFLQFNSALRTRSDLAHAEIVNIVKRLAAQTHSAALAQLASRITAVFKYGQGDPFVKVRGLISDLIARLESEAGADATEKAYCDEQLSKTAAKKSDLQSDISKLSSKIDLASSQSAKLKDEVHELQAELATLAKQQAEMNAIRQESHAAFVQAKADLEQGLEGVRKALSMLRDYYGSAAMLQTEGEQPAQPDYHSKATGAGTSIVGILEVVESDFATNLATESTQEDDAASAYEKMTQENAVTKTLKDQDEKYKTQNHKGLDKAVAELSGDRATAQTELDAVMEYDSTIKQRCIAKPETYGARSDRRAAEIKGLKDALAILEEETAFVQHGKRGFHSSFIGL